MCHVLDRLGNPCCTDVQRQPLAAHQTHPTTPPQIDVHRAAFSKAKAAMEAAAAALAAAEQRKGQLSEELTMLVMQSSGAQMRVRAGSEKAADLPLCCVGCTYAQLRVGMLSWGHLCVSVA